MVNISPEAIISEAPLVSLFNLILVVLMNLWVFPLLFAWTITGWLIALPAFLIWRIVTGWKTPKIIHFFVWIYGRGCILIIRPFIRLECRSFQREFLPCPGIIIMNHYSFFDAFMLCMLPVFDAHICMRAWPFKMFWYSFFMRLAEYINMENVPWEQILTCAEQGTKNGRYLIVFPEGHRSRTGRPGRFYSGAFKIAVELNLPILPLCITGTHTLLPPGRRWLKPAQIKMQMLKPVFPTAYNNTITHLQMRKDVYKQMTETIELMERS